MPIELRPSDVVLSAAEVLRETGRAAGSIYSRLYEADRVSQVNRQLAYLEQQYQDFNRSLAQRAFEVQPEPDAAPSYGETNYLAGLPAGARPVAPTPIQASFGEATLADIQRVEDQFFQEQLDYITRTTPNRRAREEMIQHLTMKNIANQAIVAREWSEAADHAAMASLNQLYETVMASNESWEVKVQRITSRVNEMVTAGRLWEDEGEAVITRATQEAQYSFAYHGAMDMMRLARDADAGQLWLEENTPFYDGNPDARAEVLRAVRAEFDRYAREQDEELDRGFADLHIRADTLQEVDAALGALTDVQFFDGDKKYTWEQRFLARREFLLSLAALPEAARQSLEDAQQRNEQLLWAEIAIAKSHLNEPGAMTLRAMRAMVEDSYYATWVFAGEDTNWEMGAPRIRGPAVRQLLDYLEADEDPMRDNAIRYIEQLARGLSPEEEFEATNTFMSWYALNRNATPQQMQQAAENIVNPVTQRNLDRHFRQAAQSVFGDERILDELELLTRDIQEGKLIGLAVSRAEALARYSAALVTRARNDFPGENIETAFTDYQGDYSQPGSTVLLNGSGVPYLYRLEDKVLTLWRLDDRTNQWVQVQRPEEPEVPRQPLIVPLEELPPRVPEGTEPARTDLLTPEETTGLVPEIETLLTNEHLTGIDERSLQRLLEKARRGDLFTSSDTMILNTIRRRLGARE
jgi:hypothetical protein